MRIPKGEEPSIELAGRKLYIAVPCYDGKLPVDWVRSFIETNNLARKHGLEVVLYTLSYCALVDKARDQLVRDFLIDSDCTDFLFIDSDIVWRPTDVMNMMFNVDRCGIVVGPYCVKQEEPLFHYTFWKEDGATNVQPDKYGLFRLRYSPTGFMMISREVLQKMWDKYKYTHKYYASNYDKNLIWDDEKKVMVVGDPPALDDFEECQVGLFHPMLQDGHYKGEDIAFCHRWTAEMGGAIWVDPDIKLKHIGRKSWEHDFIKYINGDKV